MPQEQYILHLRLLFMLVSSLAYFFLIIKNSKIPYKSIIYCQLFFPIVVHIKLWILRAQTPDPGAFICARLMWIRPL